MPQVKTVKSVLNELIDRSNDQIMRMRLIEQRGKGLAFRVNALEQDILQEKKKISKALDDFSGRLSSMDSRVGKMETMMKEIVEQMKRFVTQAKLQEIENLLDIYNPVKSQFITKAEVEEMIEERVQK
ncbi:MAG: hypothetical protein HY518_02985 [Candidatus Aenigmarchaeota archaeon]|nr:hypothetical protein [Candidatus Aenigmarchaeota archaeon]